MPEKPAPYKKTWRFSELWRIIERTEGVSIHFELAPGKQKRGEPRFKVIKVEWEES